MNWNSIRGVEAIKLSFCLEEGQKVTMIWICPRCNKSQIKVLNLDEMFDIELYCENTSICGEKQVYFELNITLVGYEKGLNDKPLNKSEGIPAP